MQYFNHLFRKTLIWGGVIFLAGCGTQTQKYEKLYTLGMAVIKGETGGPVITRALLEQEPRASARITLMGFQPIFLPVVAANEGIFTYQSQDRKIIQMKGGRILKVIGFGDELIGSEISPQDGAIFPKRLPNHDGSVSFVRYADYRLNNQPQTESFECTLKRESSETIEIMDYSYSTIRYSERCFQKNGRWHWTNTFWADDKTGFIWKTAQTLIPNHLEMVIEITKPFIEAPLTQNP
jgi:hypothetical protein